MESNKKQSSIEWLEQEFVKLEATVGVYSVMYELIDKAKAMHKEEIESAWVVGYDEGIDHANGEPSHYESSQQYYNETYGGGDNE